MKKENKIKHKKLTTKSLIFRLRLNLEVKQTKKGDSFYFINKGRVGSIGFSVMLFFFYFIIINL